MQTAKEKTKTINTHNLNNKGAEYISRNKNTNSNLDEYW